MKPINFRNSNKVIIAPDNLKKIGITDVYGYSDGLFFCTHWKATWLERLRFLLTGKIFITIIGKVTPPTFVDVGRNLMINKKRKEVSLNVSHTARKD
jgi:hypothetical protein